MEKKHKYLMLVKGTKRFWKYCSKCRIMIQGDDIDEFIEMCKQHQCKEVNNGYQRTNA